MKNPRFEKAPLKRLRADTEVVDEIREKLHGEGLEGLESLESVGERDFESVLASDAVQPGPYSPLEAIIQKTGRPALLVRNGEYEEPTLQAIKNRLDPHKDELSKAIASTARVELLNHPTYDYVGTAWMATEDVMVTNRHVVNVFARHSPSGIVFRVNPRNEKLEAQVDFREEHGNDEAFEVRVTEIVHLEENADYLPDMALLRIEPHEALPPPIRLAEARPDFDEDVAVIGYPAEDSRNDAFVMHRIYKGIYKVKRLSPGRVSGVREDQFLLTHDCTTLGGNSGSVVVRIATGEALGLHYAGSYLENNYAVTAQTLRNRMAALGRAAFFDVSGVAPLVRPEPGGERRGRPASVSLDDRTGYDAGFLVEEIPLPTVSEDRQGLVAPVEGRTDGRLDYIHYSVVVNAERRMAFYTACNIDGDRMFRPRRGRDRWSFDPRVSRELQAGDELYENNKLQRGHLVRRLDPVWGESRTEALRAEADTYFWTNCTPQHEGFNPRSWLALEDYVLENADNHDLKVTVFTGPVFRATDKEYRGFRIPEDYFKVLAFRNERTGSLSATAYRLTQADLMDNLEFVYGPFQTYQVPLAEIQALTGLDFGGLSDFDPLSRIETVTRIPVDSAADLVL